MDGDFHTNSGPAWVVYALTERDTGLVLMEHRDGIGAVYPGGNIEPGESVIDTARREIREKIGVDVYPEEMCEIPGYDVRDTLTHKGRTGALVVVYHWWGEIPERTIDEHHRQLVWHSPAGCTDWPASLTGGFQVGRVARWLWDYFVGQCSRGTGH